MRKVEVDFITWRQTFHDFYDLADFIKQRELQGIPTTIMGWKYVDDPSVEQIDAAIISYGDR